MVSNINTPYSTPRPSFISFQHLDHLVAGSNSSYKIEQINVSINSKLMIISSTIVKDCQVALLYKSLVTITKSSSPDSKLSFSPMSEEISHLISLVD